MAPKKKAKGANGVAKVTDAGEKGTAAEAETGVRKYTREDLRSLVYHPVRPLDVISEEIGIKAEDIAKLDANENLHPVPAEMMKAVTDALQSFGSGCSAQIYPDPSQTNFRAAIAKLHGITPDMVVAGSGSDDILDIIMRIMDADSCIICPPTFGMYKFLGAITKIRIIEVARKDDFQVDIPAVVKAIRTNKCKLVMLPSPNNPTGTLLPNEDIKVLCAEDCIVCVDEAYADFAGCSADELLKEHPNLIVCRTFSKWAGLAGLRAGYALGHPDIIERMLACKQPYNVNVAAEAMARAALEHRDKILVTVRSLSAELEKTIAFVKTFRFLKPHPTHSNFVLCDVVGVDAKGLATFLRKNGVLVRFFGTQGGQLENNIRISAGRPSDTEKLIAALKKYEATRYQPDAVAALAQHSAVDCLLWDMDGVLLDVSQSYRAAILQTAKAFGAPITSAHINKAKAAGGANNDWKLTHSLIHAHKGSDGSSPSLQEVTDAFELLYQGCGGKPGLKSLECLLPSLQVLEKLAAKYPMAVVTGRPKSDCDFALQHFGIAHLFKATACMEDGIKPDPAPLNKALKALKSKTALMFGDTVDDCRAAVAAAVIGVGVVAPGHQAEVDTPVLKAAGASVVLSEGMAELEGLLQ